MIVDGRDQCSLIVGVWLSNRRSSCFNIDFDPISCTPFSPQYCSTKFSFVFPLTRARTTERKTRFWWIWHVSDFNPCSSRCFSFKSSSVVFPDRINKKHDYIGLSSSSSSCQSRRHKYVALMPLKGISVSGLARWREADADRTTSICRRDFQGSTCPDVTQRHIGETIMFTSSSIPWSFAQNHDWLFFKEENSRLRFSSHATLETVDVDVR